MTAAIRSPALSDRPVPADKALDLLDESAANLRMETLGGRFGRPGGQTRRSGAGAGPGHRRSQFEQAAELRDKLRQLQQTGGKAAGHGGN